MVIIKKGIQTYPGDENIPLGHFPDSTQSVLHNTHDWSVGLWSDDHSRD